MGYILGIALAIIIMVVLIKKGKTSSINLENNDTIELTHKEPIKNDLKGTEKLKDRINLK